jgi:transcriptional regulator with XRE-family HTH domain
MTEQPWSKRIRALRKRLGLTQYELGMKLGMTPQSAWQQVSKWERESPPQSPDRRYQAALEALEGGRGS